MTTYSDAAASAAMANADPAGRAFIEVQFPVSKLSKESYKERKANSGQTLTALGKWWGRKPLVLVRAIILGLLLPATDDPDKDRAVFLALMTMDDDGLWHRLNGSLPVRVTHECSTPQDQKEFFETVKGNPRWKRGIRTEEKQRIQRRAFLRMSYDRRLEYCKRPEDIDGPSPEAWAKINEHLGTTAQTLPEIIQQLGERRFGRPVSVGDACAGGGSVPFEAARLGCRAHGSDLNPVAALLTWGALNIVGGGDDAVQRVKDAQQRVYAAVQQQVAEWGIEQNEEGWTADAYLYCNEVIDPATGWRVPLASSWVIGMKTNTIARLVPDHQNQRFDIEIVQGVSRHELEQARKEGTWSDGVCCPVDRDGHWLPPEQRHTTSFEQLRGHEGLRRWEADEIVPRPDDVFQERLYCIRWVEKIYHPDEDRVEIRRHYRAPTAQDKEREQCVLELLRERFVDWQYAGYIPSNPVVPGKDINRPTNARGWTHWHHFFNSRQLLINGLFAEFADQLCTDKIEKVGALLGSGRLADWNSRLCRWNPHSAHEKGEQVFYKPSLSTPFANYTCRAVSLLETVFTIDLSSVTLQSSHEVTLSDARAIRWDSDIWITDPGYADAVKYEELSEYFLAWYDKRLPEMFPGWYNDSKRVLAVSGKGETFRLSLADFYRHLAQQMPDDGFQVVMFTHLDPSVWTDLGLVLWSARLHVTAAWTIATETSGTGVKQGNYAQVTVFMVLRKQQGDRHGALSDLFPDIQAEVHTQIEQMTALDPKEDPNFGDNDYQLAAYAAALRVMTSYSVIDGLDVERELRRTSRDEDSPIKNLMKRAEKIANDLLVPDGLSRATWKQLEAHERFYLKGVSMEAHGEVREGSYQDFARGYGASGYRSMFASRAANQARLKMPSEYGTRDLRPLGSADFAGTMLRQVLFAIHKVVTDPEHDPRTAREYLRQELPDYWSSRQRMIELLRFLTTQTEYLPHWKRDHHAAVLLMGSLENHTI